MTDRYPIGARVLAGDRERTITRREVVCGQTRYCTGVMWWWPSELRPIPTEPAEITPLSGWDHNRLAKGKS